MNIRSLVLSTLFVRRPRGIPADPEASPGGVDYKSHPLPDRRMDCAPPESLFSRMDKRAIRECLNRSTKESVLVYQLQKTAMPLLALQETQKKEESRQPDCLKQLLKEIPVPREIFFEGYDDHGRFDCYASGIRPDDDRWWMARAFSRRTEVRVRLPLGTRLSDDLATGRLLLSWALAPFQDPESNDIPGRVVPEAICRGCLGDHSLIRSPRLALPLWPPPDAGY